MIERYTRKEIKKIWEENNKYQIWLSIELAVAQAMEKFRCHSQAVKSDHIERPPLNVFLMR